MFSVLKEFPVSAIRPRGWLRSYLDKQLSGLTGHIEETGHPFDSDDWRNRIDDERDLEPWWPQEQYAYWLDGLMRCAILVGDEDQFNRAKRLLDIILDNPDSDGYIGPAHLKYSDKPGRTNRWPFAIVFRAVMAYYSATGDQGILDALRTHYLSNTSDHGTGRDVCNIEAILWVYGLTSDRRLLDHALHAYREFNESSESEDFSYDSLMSDQAAKCHGVTYNETAKLGAILYIYTGEQRYLDGAMNGYRKLDRDHVLIDGVNSSYEELCGKDSLAAHETCNIADFTWSAGYLLMATGLPEYADKIERACFNAAPGAVTPDFMQFQYFSCPNQILADQKSSHGIGGRGRGGRLMAFRPDSFAACCRGNVNRIMPNYAARMWMRDTGGEGIVAALYGPSALSVCVGSKQVDVEITEETEYPFGEQIEFTIRTPEPVEFPFFLRIPGWCRSAQVLVNGSLTGENVPCGSFYKLERAFHSGDVVTLRLPMEVSLSRWAGSAVGVERGPLVYSLPIDERVETEPGNGCIERFKGLNLYPASNWNYAIGVADGYTLPTFEVETREVSGDPWSVHTAPIWLSMKARRVNGWEAEHLTETVVLEADGDFFNETGKIRYLERVLKGDFTFTPPLPDHETVAGNLDEEETIALVPYGCTNLRITLFPYYAV